MGNIRNYCLKMNSAQNSVTLPKPVENISKLKIRTLNYVTATAGQRVLLIKIQGWTDNNTYFNGSVLTDYTKIVSLVHKTDSILCYENTNAEIWDVVKSSPVSSLMTFNVEIMIDGVYSTDITPSNPLYLELVFE